MSNLFDYINWRGDLHIYQDGINEVDGVIFAELAYVLFDDVLKEYDSRMTLRDAGIIFLNKFDKKSKQDNITTLEKNTADILRCAIKSERFGSLFVTGYTNVINKENAMQFGAITFELGNENCFVAFRGTDDSLAGWEEDLDLCYKCPVMSQIAAEGYLRKIIAEYSGDIYVGGHSKGGNLAVYSLYKQDKTDRVRKVYNYDGPGFLQDIIEDDRYGKILPLIESYMPQESLVGMMMSHDEFNIVRSEKHGITQHCPIYWQVMGCKFENAESFKKISVTFNRMCNKWVSEIGTDERALFVNIVFEILKAPDADTFGKFSENILKNTNTVIKSYTSLDKNTKKMIKNIMRQVLKLGGQSIAKNHSGN